jgi:ankyrin repeat protein
MTPLMHACRGGHAECVKILLEIRSGGNSAVNVPDALGASHRYAPLSDAPWSAMHAQRHACVSCAPQAVRCLRRACM